MGAGFRFDIELRCGAGAYICGEETALFNSIEGMRGEPRNKPPFPVSQGCSASPPAINNVETLVNVLVILRHRRAGLRGDGHAGLHGHQAVLRVAVTSSSPGIYEVALRHDARETARSRRRRAAGPKLKAILLGGAAGAFVGPDELDLPLSFEAARERGVTWARAW